MAGIYNFVYVDSGSERRTMNNQGPAGLASAWDGSGQRIRTSDPYQTSDFLPWQAGNTIKSVAIVTSTWTTRAASWFMLTVLYSMPLWSRHWQHCVWPGDQWTYGNSYRQHLISQLRRHGCTDALRTVKHDVAKKQLLSSSIRITVKDTVTASANKHQTTMPLPREDKPGTVQLRAQSGALSSF